jgi:phospholipase/carboxylesterase
MKQPNNQEIGALINEPLSTLSYRKAGGRAPGAPRARLLLLHGVGGNETDLAGLAACIDPGVEVLLVRGPLTLSPFQHAWFEVSFQSGGPVINAAQAEHSRQQLITLLHALRAQDGAAALPSVIAGFSQGGILSASVGLSAPQDVNGFAILSGRILPELEPHLAAPAALAGLSAFIAHGHYDNKLPIEWAERADHWLNTLGVPHHNAYYAMGHEISAPEVADFQRWLQTPLALD